MPGSRELFDPGTNDPVILKVAVSPFFFPQAALYDVPALLCQPDCQGAYHHVRTVCFNKHAFPL
jgi:hypothetical protein